MPIRHTAARRPEEFSSFVGRATEVSELRELLRAARAVTLAGPGGIGKSRLALRLLGAVGADFPDGAWFVELGDVRLPEQVVPWVAGAIGIDEERGRALIDTICDAFRHRRALLVLDNCEHLIDACASLCQRLLASAPGLQVVATSREPLRVAAEALWPVPPLRLPPADVDSLDLLRGYDAVRLFGERAAGAAPGFALGPGNAATVAAICRALDGLPLAIELAAAWVRVLSVEQIAARLDHRLALLTSTDRAVPARQQTLRATFDWSCDLLSEPERTLLRRLSALAGWSLDMAERVCAGDGLAADEVLDLLTALTDKSLVEFEPGAPGQDRYRMLDTIREYASGLLEQAGEMPLMRRRRRDYTVAECERRTAIGMALVPAPWSARVESFRRVDVEAGNLREVLAECLADGDAETGLRICLAVNPVWLVRGAFAAGAARFDGFLELPGPAAVSGALRGRALVARGQLAMAMGDEQAAEFATAGVELCWAEGESFWLAAGLNLLTEIALHSGRLDDAGTRGSEALQVARSTGDRWNEGYALGTLAAAAAARGNLRQAEQLAEQALAVMRAIEQHWGSARMMLGLGDLARQREEYEVARDYYLAALDILREVTARPEIARCLAGLGRIELAQSSLDAARGHLSESLRLSFDAGSRIGIARGLEGMARLAVREHKPELAVRLAGAVSALRAQAKLPSMPGARRQRFLDAAAGLGEHAVTRLWQDGVGLTAAAAVRLALGDETGGKHWLAASPPAPAPTSAPATALTAREHEVVALLGAGLSNRDIATKLYISPATAARHVANILAKLGFSSRSQVAAWASSDSPD